MKKNLVYQIAADILKSIVETGQFHVGDKIPSENELSKSYNVSRSTIREALKLLSVQGYLRSSQGKGTFVCKDSPITDSVGISDNMLKKARVKDLFEARLIFEPGTAAIACVRASDEEIEEILAIGYEVERLILSGQDRTVSDQRFHQALIKAAHNGFLLQLLPIIDASVSETILFGSSEKAIADHTLRDHAMIMGFLKARDSDGVMHAMSIHIHHAISELNFGDEEPIF